MVGRDYIDRYLEQYILRSVMLQGGHIQCMKILLSAGATVDGTSNSGKTALVYATIEGRAEAIELLKEHGAT